MVVLTTVQGGLRSAAAVNTALERHRITLTHGILTASLLRLQLEYILVRDGSHYRYAVPQFREHVLLQPIAQRVNEEVQRVKAEFGKRSPAGPAEA